MFEENEDSQAPLDPKRYVYVIFYWLGISTLLPWNFFISVPEYWMYKYRLLDKSVEGNSELQIQWNSRMAVAAMVPNVLLLNICACVGHRFRTRPRLIASLIVIVVIFLLTSVLSNINTDSWQDAFFILSLICVSIITTSAAIFQNALFAIVGKFPPQYIGGVFSSQALAGLIASIFNVIMLLLGASTVGSAFYCFLFAGFFVAVALGAYLIVSEIEFYQYYHVEQDELNYVKGMGKDKISLIAIFKSIWVYALCVFWVFTITLACFPGLTTLIVSVGSGSDWSDKYFVPVIGFVGFNVGDYAGRCLAESIKYPQPDKRGKIIVGVATCLRTIFIILFLFCNASPKNRNLTSVAFKSDPLYAIFMLLFSLSNGYLGSICMMSAPLLVKTPQEQSTSASIMVGLLGMGLGAGALLSTLIIRLL